MNNITKHMSEVDKILNGLISIIIPVYNVGDYLEYCLNSVLNRTYRNLEIIVIDDGSEDNTAEIIDEFAKRDKRIKAIHTNNCGVSHARNVGLNTAHGEYIGFVDGDDWVDEDTYEHLLREIVNNNADVAGGGYICEEENGGYITLKKEKRAVYSRNDILQVIFSCDVPKLLYWELCDKLFKKELVTNTRFDESIGTAEDKLFFGKL
ncbi:glycosyltransferase [Selenomonas sp. AE3005]|uniref:glycosyltransferase family 2 protein n=1 Tax=Selenomonas sp. AE3005 TaxID=1485543 RepID=UPI0006896118|nr:glycosyltransferase [Selenomonas sp. AE3005]